MNGPTPPTKPIPPTPPTPPSMTATSATDTHTSGTAGPGGTTPAKADMSITGKGTDSQTKTGQNGTTPAESGKPASSSTSSAASSADQAKFPPAASFSSDNETAANTAIPTAMPKSKDNPMPFGVGFYSALIFVAAISLVLFRWWKSSKPKPRNIINYSTGTSQELIDLINAPETEPIQPSAVKAKPVPKVKSNFEIRV